MENCIQGLGFGLHLRCAGLCTPQALPALKKSHVVAKASGDTVASGTTAASLMGSLLGRPDPLDKKLVQAAQAAEKTEKETFFQVLRAWEHMLQLCGHGPAAFKSAKLRSSIFATRGDEVLGRDATLG